MKIFDTSQFNYCSLVYMFDSRRLNHRINSIHERALRVTYQDYKSAFLQVLEKDNSVIILATEIFKAKNDLSPEITKVVFELKELYYSLRSKGNLFVRGNVKTTHYGFGSIKYLALKIWHLIPDQIKHCGSSTKFKHFIKSWSPSNCPCQLCKTYISQSYLHLIKNNNEIR